MDAENTDLADKRVTDDFEDVSKNGHLRTRLRGNRCAVTLFKERHIGFGRRGKVTNDDLHEVADTNEVLGACKAHRNDVTFAKRFGNRSV